MEEGPEPQEWVERAAEEHHHGAHNHSQDAPAHGGEMTLSAITAAILAVLAAIGSLLSGHAVNQAILGQTKATDQWSYYQAKSTKEQLYEVGGKLIQALAPAQNPPGESHSASLRQFEEQKIRYEHEKEDIQKEAEHLEAESRHELHKHHQFALGIACFQVGIVLASVSILVRRRAIYYLSLVAGAGGLVWTVMGQFWASFRGSNARSSAERIRLNQEWRWPPSLSKFPTMPSRHCIALPRNWAGRCVVAAAMLWYSQGRILARKAAQIAGVSQIDLIDALAAARLPAFHVDVDKLMEEVELARQAICEHIPLVFLARVGLLKTLREGAAEVVVPEPGLPGDSGSWT